MFHRLSQIREGLRIHRGGLLLLLLWTIMLGASLTWNLWQGEKAVLAQAASEAKAHFDKDLVYRQWNTLHGGVYVPVSEHAPPNPYLSHLPDRDVVTTSGRRLTLVNPAYMTRQVQDLSRQLYGVQGHLTSLQVDRQGNAPDPWEKEALQVLAGGANEVSQVTEIDGSSYLRFMRPLFAGEGCLKCHGHQGYKVGDVRGGISMSVPLAAYYSLRKEQLISLTVGHLLIYLFGAFTILAGARSLGNRARENEKIRTDIALDRERVQALLALSTFTVSTEEELINFVLEEAVRLTGSEVGYFHFYDETSQAIELCAWSRKVVTQCTVPELEHSYSLEKAGIWADCIRRRKPVVHNDYESRSDKKGVPQGHFLLKRHMSVPVMDGERIVAISGVGNKVQPYADHDVAQLLLYMGKAWDIIKDRRARIKAREQERGLQLFRSLIDQSYDAIFIVSVKNGCFLDVNGRACEILGYNREELLRLGLLDVSVDLIENFVWKSYVEELRRNSSMLLERYYKRKDGGLVSVEVNIRLVSHEKDAYIIVVARDITERKASEKELEEYRVKLEEKVLERTATLEERTAELEKSQTALQFLLEDVNEVQKEVAEKNRELERFNQVMVGRELRMIELKNEIRELRMQFGQDVER